MNIEKIEFQINNKCNMNCSFCFQGENRDSNEINFDYVVKSLDELNPTLKTVWLTGGEPLLSKDLLLKIVNESKKRDHYVGISSNGLLLNKHIDQLISNGVDEVRISFDSLEKDLFESIRGCAGSFDKVKQNIIHAINKKIKVSLRCTVTKKNCNSIIDIIHFARDTGVKRLELKSVLPIGKGDKDSIVKPELLQRIFHEAVSMQTKEFEVMIMCNHLPRCKGFIVNNNFSCKCANEYLYMYVDGSIAPCSYFPRDPTYNINHRSFNEVWNSEFFEKVRTAHPNECSNCNHYADCKNGCPAVLFSNERHNELCYSVMEEL